MCVCVIDSNCLKLNQSMHLAQRYIPGMVRPSKYQSKLMRWYQEMTACFHDVENEVTNALIISAHKYLGRNMYNSVNVLLQNLKLESGYFIDCKWYVVHFRISQLK